MLTNSDFWLLSHLLLITYYLLLFPRSNVFGTLPSSIGQPPVIKSDDLLVNLSSKISYLNQEQRLLLAKQLLESDPDIFNKITKEK
jgi:hypothetical protein